MVSEAQKKATRKWRQTNTRTIAVILYPADNDIREWIEAQPSKNAAIKAALRAYMAQEHADADNRAL